MGGGANRPKSMFGHACRTVRQAQNNTLRKNHFNKTKNRKRKHKNTKTQTQKHHHTETRKHKNTRTQRCPQSVASDASHPFVGYSPGNTFSGSNMPLRPESKRGFQFWAQKSVTVHSEWTDGKRRKNWRTTSGRGIYTYFFRPETLNLWNSHPFHYSTTPAGNIISF